SVGRGRRRMAGADRGGPGPPRAPGARAARRRGRRIVAGRHPRGRHLGGGPPSGRRAARRGAPPSRPEAPPPEGGGRGPRPPRPPHPGQETPPMPGQVHFIDPPLVQHKLSLMRMKSTGPSAFRNLLAEISMLLAYEVTRDMPTHSVTIDTPLARTAAPLLDGK